MYIRLVELPTCRANALDRASLHITYIHGRRTSYEEKGGVGPACARHGVYTVRCMHVSFCMHFCRRAEAQIFLMQECHASVACHLSRIAVHMALMRNDARSSTTSATTRSRGPSLFDYII